MYSLRRPTLAICPRSQPVVRHNSALLGETLDMLSLLAQETLRDEERKVRILRPRSLDPTVEVVS